MEKLFEVASAVSTPLGLGGLFAAVLFYIFKQILAKDFVRQMTTAHSAEVIKLIIERLFVLALVAMILGFVSYILTKLPPPPPVFPPAISSTKTPSVIQPDPLSNANLPSSPSQTSQATDHLDTEQRYELITLAQNGCYFFVPGEAKTYAVTEYIELAQKAFVDSLTASEGMIEVAGYMETGHSAQYAQKLSERRAQAVKSILVGRYGIDAHRISTQGLGTRHNQKWVREYFCGARVSVANK